MSAGVSVVCEPEVEGLEGYFQELAAEYEVLAGYLKEEGVNILPYLFCPESDLSEEEALAAGYSQDDIKAMKVISQEDYHDPDEVYDDIVQAADLVRGMEQDAFESDKDALVEDLEGLAEDLETAVEEKVQVQLLRG